ncbi:hypothetical protein HTVC115P_gp64 [Pelagibacter phage HTVC115P]|nr:hypothetical protein HTVC115P_gp64 [Pelagibacter phage HTVC115P]
MAFLGNRPAENYISYDVQHFTTSATTSYTLDHAVANENELRLVINNVVQQPGGSYAYSASGTSLTLTSATSATDTMYCVYLGKATSTVNPPSGSVGSSQISADLITGQTALGATPADTDELLISDAGTLKRVDFSYLKSTNTPSFRATMSADQDGNSSEANTKVAFNTETYDEGSCYDHSSNYRFTVPSGEGGKYLIIAHTHTRTPSNAYSGKACRLYKNGSFLTESQTATAGDNLHTSRTNNEEVTTIEDLSAGDYIEVYVKVFGSSYNIESEGSYFSACKLII